MRGVECLCEAPSMRFNCSGYAGEDCCGYADWPSITHISMVPQEGHPSSLACFRDTATAHRAQR